MYLCRTFRTHLKLVTDSTLSRSCNPPVNLPLQLALGLQIDFSHSIKIDSVIHVFEGTSELVQ